MLSVQLSWALHDITSAMQEYCPGKDLENALKDLRISQVATQVL